MPTATDPSGAGQGLDRVHYLAFIIPLLLVGAGFVLSTTVRTAIVFAGTPRGLAATAAAVNEASVALGARIGVVAGTTAVLFASLAAARELLADVTKDVAGPLAEQLEVGLVSIGTPRFEEVLRVVLEEGEQLKRTAYSVAYVEGVAIALVFSGLVGVGGAVLAWFLTGRRDPIKTVYDMEDERSAP